MVARIPMLWGNDDITIIAPTNPATWSTGRPGSLWRATYATSASGHPGHHATRTDTAAANSSAYRSTNNPTCTDAPSSSHGNDPYAR